jgi:hypothetical protein
MYSAHHTDLAALGARRCRCPRRLPAAARARQGVKFMYAAARYPPARVRGYSERRSRVSEQNLDDEDAVPSAARIECFRAVRAARPGDLDQARDLARTELVVCRANNG